MLGRKLYFLVLLLFLHFSSTIYAGISVKPTVTEIRLSPGKRKVGTFTVANDGDNSLHIKVEPEDWMKKEETVGVSSWLRVKPLEFELAGGDSRKVKYKIEVPQDAEGELVAMVFFGSITPAGGGLGIQTRFGVSIYVAIEGTEVVEANIEKLDATRYGGGSSDNYGINFGVTVANTGNVHIRPKGKISIENENGERVKDLDIFYGFPVFPQAKRTFPAIWRGGELPPGEYRAKVSINYGELYGLIDKICSYDTVFSVEEGGQVSIQGKDND